MCSFNCIHLLWIQSKSVAATPVIQYVLYVGSFRVIHVMIDAPHSNEGEEENKNKKNTSNAASKQVDWAHAVGCTVSSSVSVSISVRARLCACVCVCACVLVPVVALFLSVSLCAGLCARTLSVRLYAEACHDEKYIKQNQHRNPFRVVVMNNLI